MSEVEIFSLNSVNNSVNIEDKFNGSMPCITHFVDHTNPRRSQIILTCDRHQLMYGVFCPWIYASLQGYNYNCLFRFPELNNFTVAVGT